MAKEPSEDDAEVQGWIEEIRDLLDKINRHLDPDDNSILCDGVIITGRRSFLPGGRSSVASVTVYPINPDQASYTTRGLLYEAQEILLDSEEDYGDAA